MSNAYEIELFMGSQNVSKTYYVYKSGDIYYYVQHGGTIVNSTRDVLEQASESRVINHENQISDITCFTWDNKIEDLDEMIKACEA